MTSLNPYIDFGGRCREAMTFYKGVLGGEITTMQTFGETGMTEPAAARDMIMHSELKAGGIVLQASDGRPGMPASAGDYISLALHFTNSAEQARVFAGLSAGGQVEQPLTASPWGAIFGMLTDRFGVHWLLNCPAGQA